MKKIFGHFLKGLLIVLPILVVFYIIRSTVKIIMPFNLSVPGNLIFIITFIIVTTSIGFLASRGFSSYSKRKISSVSLKFPLFSKVRFYTKKILIILNFSREIFNEPVIVKREGGKEIKFGFVTNKNLKDFNLNDYSSIYIPSPFSFFGELIIVENKYLEKIKGDNTEIINFILSGGLVSKDTQN